MSELTQYTTLEAVKWEEEKMLRRTATKAGAISAAIPEFEAAYGRKYPKGDALLGAVGCDALC